MATSSASSGCRAARRDRGARCCARRSRMAAASSTRSATVCAVSMRPRDSASTSASTGTISTRRRAGTTSVTGVPRYTLCCMDPALKEKLRPYLKRPEPAAGQTPEQALNAEATSLAYLARTYLDWDGPLKHDELVELIRTS